MRDLAGWFRLLLCLIFFSAIAHAVSAQQPTTPAQMMAAPAGGDPSLAASTDADSDQAAAAPVGANDEPTPSQLVDQANGVLTSWKQLGYLAGLVALVNLLINLLKLTAVKKWFDEHNKTWMLSYIAVGLGAILGVLSVFLTHANPVQSVVAGVLAGLGAIGGHETITKLFTTKSPAAP